MGMVRALITSVKAFLTEEQTNLPQNLRGYLRNYSSVIGTRSNIPKAPEKKAPKTQEKKQPELVDPVMPESYIIPAAAKAPKTGSGGARPSKPQVSFLPEFTGTKAGNAELFFGGDQ